MELEITMLGEVSYVQQDKGCMFLSYVVDRSKYQYLFPVVRLLEETRGGVKEEVNDRE
jgi:predicted PP-loop superfamily ATPase